MRSSMIIAFIVSTLLMATALTVQAETGSQGAWLRLKAAWR